MEDHFPDPSVRKTIEVDISLIDHYDQLLGKGKLDLTRSAKVHDVQTFSRLQSVPGIGQILALANKNARRLWALMREPTADRHAA